MPTYTNIGGGQSQLSSLYTNNNGVAKDITAAYANVSGTNKQIYNRIYKYGKHTFQYYKTLPDVAADLVAFDDIKYFNLEDYSDENNYSMVPIRDIITSGSYYISKEYSISINVDTITITLSNPLRLYTNTYGGYTINGIPYNSTIGYDNNLNGYYTLANGQASYTVTYNKTYTGEQILDICNSRLLAWQIDHYCQYDFYYQKLLCTRFYHYYKYVSTEQIDSETKDYDTVTDSVLISAINNKSGYGLADRALNANLFNHVRIHGSGLHPTGTTSNREYMYLYNLLN